MAILSFEEPDGFSRVVGRMLGIEALGPLSGHSFMAMAIGERSWKKGMVGYHLTVDFVMGY